MFLRLAAGPAGRCDYSQQMRSVFIVRSRQANLGLFRLLLLLLCFSFRDRGEPLLCPDLYALCALGHDGCKVRTNNAALVFYGFT